MKQLYFLLLSLIILGYYICPVILQIAYNFVICGNIIKEHIKMFVYILVKFRVNVLLMSI